MAQTDTRIVAAVQTLDPANYTTVRGTNWTAALDSGSLLLTYSGDASGTAIDFVSGNVSALCLVFPTPIIASMVRSRDLFGARMEYNEPSADGMGCGIGFVATTGATVGMGVSSDRAGSGTEDIRRINEAAAAGSIEAARARLGGVQLVGMAYHTSGSQNMSGAYDPATGLPVATQGSGGGATNTLGHGDALYPCIFGIAAGNFSVTPGTVRITKVGWWTRQILSFGGI
jgi:hypothetical protein